MKLAKNLDLQGKIYILCAEFEKYEIFLIFFEKTIAFLKVIGYNENTKVVKSGVNMV